MVSLTDSWGRHGGCREVAANPPWPVCLSQGTPHTPCTLSEDSQPQKWSVLWKVLTQKTSCTGVLSWAHTPDNPHRKLMPQISAVKNETFKVLVSCSSLYVYTQHPAPRFVLQSQWTPEATFNLLNVPPTDSTARDTVKKRKHEGHTSALKNPSRLCGNAKKKPHKLQVFSEAEQFKPRGRFLRCLSSSDKVICLNHHISFCPAWSPDTHFSLVWINSQYFCCYSQWKKKSTKIQDQGGSFWNNKWQKLVSQREYDKKPNNEDCTYHKFAPCFPTTSTMLRLMSTNLSISNAWKWGEL